MKTNELLRSLALHKGMQIIAVLNADDGEQPFDIQNCETREFASYGGKIFLDRSDFKKEYLKHNSVWIAEYPMKKVEAILDDVCNQYFNKKMFVIKLGDPV